MNDPEMWEHYCEVEHSLMGVGKDEPCNWCGLTEEELFDTEIEMHDYYSKKENFEKLVKGEEGKNLMHTHVTHWIASEIEVIIDKAEQWFHEKQVLKLELIKDALNFVRAKSTKVFSDDRLKHTVLVNLNYNILIEGV